MSPQQFTQCQACYWRVLLSRLYGLHNVMSLHSPISLAAETSLLQSLMVGGAVHGHRSVVVFSGEREWGLSLAEAILPLLGLRRLLWLGDVIPPGTEVLAKNEARRQLGRELDGVVLDAYAGFDAEIFGAVAGAIRAGGLFLLLAPALERWHEYPDPEHARLAVTPVEPGEISGRFLRHLATTLRHSAGVHVFRQGQPLPDIPVVAGAQWRQPLLDDGVTAGQRLAVEAISRVAHGHRHRPLVLTSDRGRGKSAVLGIAAARLLQEGLPRILVTAPRLVAVEQLFAHAERCLPGAERSSGVLQWQGRLIEFVPPDALTLQPREASLLLVDEAAAIPTALLERMLTEHARIVFASTIHGYEGTGRGFALRFFRVLDARTPGWRLLRMEQPVRWSEGDPLEGFTYRALMLDAEPAADAAVADATPLNCHFEQLDRDALLLDERLLAELFGLLVIAHYRTSPADLRHLLDGPNVRVYILRHGAHVVATALVAREGGLPAELAQGIYEGRRRAHGHLMPQSLAVHAGFPEASLLHAERVMRIAVHPAVQGRGLGQKLLERIHEQARYSGADYLGASFGATAELLGFWQRGGVLPVRVGLTREASSGTHSVMVMVPLSPDGEALFESLRIRLSEQLPLMLGEPLNDVDAALVSTLFQLMPPVALSLSPRDWQDVRTFGEALRGYEVCLSALWRLVPPALAGMVVLTPAQRVMLIEKVLQRRGWKAVAETSGLSGKAEAVAALREVYRQILDHYRGQGIFPPSGEWF